MTARRTVSLFFLILIAMVVAPQTADACPVCFSAKEGSREAFLLTTAFLTFLPLGMIGSLVFWFRKHLEKGGD